MIQFLGVFTVIVSLGFSAVAEDAEKLLQDFQRTKVSLMKNEEKQRQALGALFEINRRTKKIVGEKANLEQEKLVVDSSVRELAQKIMALEQKTKSQKILLRERLSAMYKLGGKGMARLLFTSSSSVELERNLKILGIVATQDVEMIKDYAESARELQSKKTKLTARWNYLQELGQKIKSQELKLSEQSQQKNQILDEVRHSQQFAMKKLSQIRKKTQQIAAQDDAGVLDLLFQPSFYEQKGKLPKPIQGSMVQGFGLIKDEVHNVVLSHKGQFYVAPLGTEVKAIFSGQVAFAGNVDGFGKTVIVDHGDHYYSVYSHASAFKVHEGEPVQQAQTIALSGRSPAGAMEDSGSGLYFEIRHFSEPADPKNWMKGNL